MGTRHGGGIYTRGMDKVPTGPGGAGKFGRMFRELPIPETVDVAALRALSETMRDDRRPPEGDNPAIPAGYTYLGQFVDHDITFDITPLSAAFNDPEGITNHRTPGLDLDSMYGGGPAQHPFLYDQVFGGGNLKMVIGASPGGDDVPRMPDAVPPGADPSADRDPVEIAVIGDPRNDENLIVSQVHTIFLKFHNRMVDLVVERMGLTGDADGIAARRDDVFKDAQRLTRWHYQWVVANDFCRRICGDAVVDSILLAPDPDAGRPLRRVETRFYATGPDASIPLEFAVAAYRLGHSMIRGRYTINTTITGRPIFDAEAPFTAGTRQDFRGGRRLPAFWDHEMALFFAGVPPVDAARVGDLELQPSRLIDTKLASGLFELTGLEGDMANLAFRNLRRGALLELPAGQTVASAMGEQVLTADELGFADAGLPADMPAPLWFYVLREAEVRTGGVHLGPVGGRIVAEVLLGLLASSSLSFLRVQPNWLPEVTDTDGDGLWTMTDLVNVAVHGLGTLSPAPMAPAEA